MVQATPLRMVAFERRVILEAGYKIQRSNTKTLFRQAFKNRHRTGTDLRRQLYLSTTWYKMMGSVDPRIARNTQINESYDISNYYYL
jgi:hypothetical protein